MTGRPIGRATRDRSRTAVMGRHDSDRAAHRAFIVLLVLVVAGCGTAGGSASQTATASGSPGAPSASETPDATVSPGQTAAAATATPSPSPTPFAGVPGVGFQNWGIGEVLVDGLRVREAPGSGAPPVLIPGYDTEIAYVLNQGDQVLVTGGGAEADGYRWWEIFGAREGSTMASLHGYVANGPPADPWIVPAEELACPEGPTFADLVGMPPFLRLACYGNAPLTFVAYAWTVPEDAGLGGACLVEPEQESVRWLLCENINYAWVNATGNADWTFLLHFDPLVLPEPDWPEVEGRRLTITGHFDDPASNDCSAGIDDPDEASFSYWTCAMLFVVDELAVG